MKFLSQILSSAKGSIQRRALHSAAIVELLGEGFEVLVVTMEFLISHIEDVLVRHGSTQRKGALPERPVININAWPCDSTAPIVVLIT